MDTKTKTPIYAVCKRLTSNLGTHTDKVRGWKKLFHANGDQKKVGVAILISDKVDFKIKTMTRDKEGHYIMIKGSIQEYNNYKHMHQHKSISVCKANANKHERGNFNSSIVIVGDFNTRLTPMDKTTKQN